MKTRGLFAIAAVAAWAQQPDTWAPLGPAAATLFELAQDPAEPRVWYAGTSFGGVYRSTDTGRTWSQLPAPFDTHSVFAIVHDPRIPGRVWAGSFPGGVYRSDDNARSWRQMSSGLGGESVLKLAIDPGDAGRLVAATPVGPFFSTDAGESWRRSTADAGLAGSIALAFHPFRQNEVYLGGPFGVLKSSDGGASWVSAIDQPGFNVVALQFSPATGSLYAASPGKILVLRPGSQVWTDVTEDLPGGIGIQSIAVRQEGGSGAGTIFIASGGGAFFRPEADTGWSLASIFPCRFTRFYDGAVVLGDFYGQGLRVSHDNGFNWETRVTGFQNLFVGAMTLGGAAGRETIVAGTDNGVFGFSPASVWSRAPGFLEGVFSLFSRPGSDTVYAGTERLGVWQSENAGVTWKLSASGIVPPNVSQVAATPDGGYLFAATVAGFFSSYDSGETWSPQQTLGIAFSVTVDLTRPLRVMFGGPNGAVFLSNDAGANFQYFGRGLPLEAVKWLKSIPFHETYAALGNGAIYALGYDGTEWAPVFQRASAYAFGVDVHPSEPETVHAATVDGLYRSSDRGASWTRVDGGLGRGAIVSVLADLDSRGVWYAGGVGKVHRSADNGLSWTELGSGLPEGPVIALARAGGGSSALFASVPEKGVYRLGNGNVWRRLPGMPAEGSHSLTTALLDPNRLAAGTSIDGVYVSGDAGESFGRSNRGLSLFVGGISANADFSTMYAASLQGGVFRSEDRGATWRNGGLRDRNLYAVAADPSDSNAVYAGSSLGVSVSTDRGKTWSDLTQRISLVRAVAVDPRNASAIWAGGANGRVNRSVDGGRSWSTVSGGLPAGAVSAVVIDSRDGAAYVSLAGQGVYRSANEGASWDRVSERGDVRVLIASPRGGVLYAGATDGSVFQIDEAGRWLPLSGNLPRSEILALAVDMTSPATLLAAVREGVYRTTDGRTWQNASQGLSGVPADLSSDSSRPGRLFAATSRGLFTSTDGGSRWNAVQGGLPSQDAVAVALDEGGRLVAVAFAEAGLWTGDGSGSWRRVRDGVKPQPHALRFAAAAILVGTEDQGLLRSPDSGATWQATPGIATGDFSCLVLGVHPKRQGLIYAGCVGPGMLRSTDGGRQWTPINRGLPESQILAMALDPEDPGFVAIGKVKAGVFATSDGGETWRALGEGISSRTVTSLVFDTRDRRTFYAGTEGAGVYKLVRSRGVQ